MKHIVRLTVVGESFSVFNKGKVASVHDLRSAWSEWGAPGLLLVGLAVAFFAPALWPGMILYAGDMAQWYPIEMLVANSLHKGYLPLWNPYAASGHPIFGYAPLFYPANLIFVFFPLPLAFTLSYIFHFALAGFGTYLFLRFLGANRFGSLIGAVAFEFSGHLTLRVFAGHPHVIQSIAWIPLAFLFLERALSRKSLADGVLTGLVLGLQMLVAWPQISLYLLLSLVAYWVVRMVRIVRCDIQTDVLRGTRIWPTSRILLGEGGRLGLALLVAFGVAAVYLLPSQASVSLSLRSGGLDFPVAASGSFPPHNILALLMPNFYGSERERNYWGYFLGDASYVEDAAYIGVLPLMLALVALVWWRGHYKWILCGLALFWLVFAMGRFMPVFLLSYHFIPGIKLFRSPARSIILSILVAAVLAGFGATYLTGKHDPQEDRVLKRLLWLFVVSVGLGGMAWVILQTQQSYVITWGERLARLAYTRASWEHARPLQYSLDRVRSIVPTLPGNFLMPTAMALIGAGLCVVRVYWPDTTTRLHPQHVIPSESASEGSPTEPTICPCRARFLVASLLGMTKSRCSTNTGRIVGALMFGAVVFDLWFFGLPLLPVMKTADILDPQQRQLLTFLGSADREEFRVYAANSVLPVNFGNVVDVFEVQSDFPMAIRRYWELLNPEETAADAGFTRPLLREFNARALELLSVRYAITTETIDSPGWHLVRSLPMQVTVTDRAVGDYPVSRQATVHIYEKADPLPRAFLVCDFQVISADRDALQAIYSHEFDPMQKVILAQDPGIPAAASSGHTNAQIISYSPNRIILGAETAEPCLLVVTEVFAPGWKASVDGYPQPILRANYTFRAVALQPGKHRVEMVYDPPLLRLGAGLSTLTGLSLALGFGCCFWRRQGTVGKMATEHHLTR